MKDFDMKILFILPSLTLGGLERALVTLANALTERGHNVTVLVLNNVYDLKDDLNPSVRLIYKSAKPHKIMKRIPYIRYKFYDDGMWETRASAKTLYKYYVGDEKYDVEIGFFRGLSVKIISGSTNKTSTKLAWVHSDFKHCRGITNNFGNIKKTKAGYAKFKKIVCVSKQAEDSFREVIGLKDKTTVINNIIEEETITQLSKEPIEIHKSKFTMVSVGRLTYAKGYDRLLKVVKRLNDSGYDFDLWLVGGGEDEEMLKKYAKDNNLSNVKFLGKKPNPYGYMKAADLYICSSYFEGFPLTVSEAVLLEMPILSTDCSGSNEILAGGEYGMLVDNSTEGLYNGINDLLKNKGVLDTYKSKAILRKPFFDKEKILGKIENLL